MDEYQLNDLLISQQGLLVQGLALFVSILFGYLLLAHLVGRKLTAFDTAAVSVLYGVTAGFTGWMIARWASEAGEISRRLEQLGSNTVAPTPPGYLGWVMLALLVAAVSMPLLYMWRVRRNADLQ